MWGIWIASRIEYFDLKSFKGKVGYSPNPQPLIPLMGQGISYTAFAQPATVTEGSYELSYTYGSDYNRIRSITKQSNNEINRRYYFGGYERDIMGGTIRDLHYIGSPAGLIAIVVRENGSDIYRYVYTDHLGSILTVTNSSGSVEAEQSFDAWGRRRNASTWVPMLPTASPGLPVWLYRGYTGHEQLDQFGLINMNGRLYDPALGRVLSVDNYVQDPFGTQNYNRYSYVLNNPLKYIDPDGNLVYIIPQISFGRGGFSLGIEIGIGIPGVLSASATGGYNFRNKKLYGSVQGFAGGFYAGFGTSGGFAGYGYRYAGISIGVGYGSGGWNAGISYGGTTANNFSGSVGIGWSQKGGLDWNISGAYTYTFEKVVRNKIIEYELKNAPSNALQQKSGFDCLICASEYLDQLPGGQSRSYKDIMELFGVDYNPEQGSNTQESLTKLFGEGNVKSHPQGNPHHIGSALLEGNPSVIAMNNNHALVITKLEIWNKQIGGRNPSTYFNIKVMNPAVGRFQYMKNYNWIYPVFTIKLR